MHKLDQLQFPPNSKNYLRVPDLLAVFEKDGKEYPVLIEVKSKQDMTLSWRPDYLNSLERYSNFLKLPLLIAWKYRTFWTLFENRHMQQKVQNHNISFETVAGVGPRQLFEILKQ